MGRQKAGKHTIYGKEIIKLSPLGFLSGSAVKNLSANARDVGSIPGSGRSPRKGNGNPLQYSCLGNPMNRGTWQGYSPWGRKRVGPNLATKHHHPLNHTSTHCQGVDLQWSSRPDNQVPCWKQPARGRLPSILGQQWPLYSHLELQQKYHRSFWLLAYSWEPRCEPQPDHWFESLGNSLHLFENSVFSSVKWR